MTTVSYTLPGGTTGAQGEYGPLRGFRLTTNADLGPANPIVHDLHLEGGNLTYVDEIPATIQEVKTRLLFFKGEAFSNLLEGIPYFQQILRKGVDENRAKSIISRAILSVPTIVEVSSITFNLDREFRVASVDWSARTNTGITVSSEDFEPLFIQEDKDR